MAGTLIQKKKSESEQEIVLRLLEHVASDGELSQDRFAKRIGIAKGLANAYFNRCLKKGWIKLRQVPKQRFLYYLSPQGFAEKARLTAQFLSYSFQFYRDARADLLALLREASEGGQKRLVVLGTGELAEIAAIISEECPIEIVGFVAPGDTRRRLAGRPIVARWTDIDAADGAVLATLENAQFVFQSFRAAHPAVKVFVPKQLRSHVWRKLK
jgi:hypothetical protein